jgi:hypothetical protein
MGKTANALVLMGVASLLSGCAVQNLGSQVLKTVFHTQPGPPPVPAQQQVSVGNNLSLPPDLQLAVPGQTTDAYVPNQGTGEGDAHDMAVAKANLPPPPPVAAPSVFAEYGIPIVDENGDPRPRAVLVKELKAAILARKKAKNPNYGTIKNIRNIFKDE